MKKKIFSFAALLMIAVAALTISSCSKNDDTTTPEQSNLVYDIKLGGYVTADVVKYYNFSAEYVDDNGKTVSLPLSTKPEDVTVKINGDDVKFEGVYSFLLSQENVKTPATKTINVKFSVKEGIELSDDDRADLHYVCIKEYVKHSAGSVADKSGLVSKSTLGGYSKFKIKAAYDSMLAGLNHFYNNLSISIP